SRRDGFIVIRPPVRAGRVARVVWISFISIEIQTSPNIPGVGALERPRAIIIGCRVRREPEGSTERYTRWINSLSPEQLLTQVYTSHGPTVIMPTWLCSRDWFQRVGRFDEGGLGVPEDLLFFYESLRRGGGVHRVDDCLLVYRYHDQAATQSVLEETIWMLRVAFLQERVLSQWEAFTIWNAGKQGRRLYRSLSVANRRKVRAFCDVDENKIRKGFYTYEESKVCPSSLWASSVSKRSDPSFSMRLKPVRPGTDEWSDRSGDDSCFASFLELKMFSRSSREHRVVNIFHRDSALGSARSHVISLSHSLADVSSGEQEKAGKE
ncbi:hypothetical protein Z043_116163, partial [Scleropages formosus]